MKRLSIIFITIFLFALADRTFAEDFTVNLTTDQHDASRTDGICDIDLETAGEQCTLRAAIEQDTITNFARADRILFDLPNNSTITLTPSNGGELVLNNFGAVRIIGTGANNLTIDGGAGDNRIFYTTKPEVTISGVTLTGGGAAGINGGRGGAIATEGNSLTLDGVHVTGNSAPDSLGGGVFFAGASFRIINSTFSNNTAFFCGGFSNLIGTLTVFDSTVSGNTARLGGTGGGFCNSGNATLRNVTVTKNTAGNGGGVYSNGTTGILNLGNTIIAGNITSSNAYPEILFEAGAITSAGYNLIGDSSGDSTDTFTPISYQSTDIREVNPMLGALQNNGGTTPTHALFSGSPAIDKGANFLSIIPSTVLQTDQRGFARIANGTVDIGAFEFALPKSRQRFRIF